MGRFQVMAMLQAARALALGLTLDEAKRWRLNRAIFYAAARRGFRRWGTGTTRSRRRAAPATEKRYELGGEAAYLSHGAAHLLHFQIGDEEQTPADFDGDVVHRVPNWERAWAEGRAVIAAAEREDLESPDGFFAHVYRPRRDELAKHRSA
ncbi:MAG TPA: hypothetical protein VH916_01480 [Dehalococcoidia bacterium]